MDWKRGCYQSGRESFYEENQHYRILKRVLFGTGESLASYWEGH